MSAQLVIYSRPACPLALAWRAALAEAGVRAPLELVECPHPELSIVHGPDGTPLPLPRRPLPSFLANVKELPLLLFAGRVIPAASVPRYAARPPAIQTKLCWS